MNELILTSYLEDGELKSKIVKDSEELWNNVINKFKKEVGPSIYQSTIDRWKKENSFGERVLEHTTYWLIVKEHKLDPINNNKDHKKVLKLTEKLNLHQKILMALPYLKN